MCDKIVLITFCELIGFICATLSLVMSILVYSSAAEGSTYSYLSAMAKNWNTAPILRAFPSPICPSALDEAPLISDMWPGTVRGCVSNSRVSRTACGKYGTRIPEIAPIPMKVWRNTQICTTRMSGSYLDLSIVAKGKPCPSEQRVCGVLDTMQNNLCVPTSIPCPYNYFEVIPSEQPSPRGFDFQTVPLVSGTAIFSNINTNGQIINEFTMSEDVPCLDPGYKNYLYQIFLLEIHYEKYKCINTLGLGNLLDTNWELKDAYSFFNVYSENGIIDATAGLPLISGENYFTSLSKSQRTLKLYHRSYIGLNVDCIAQIKQMGIASLIIEELISLEYKMVGLDEIILYSLIFGGIGLGMLFIGLFIIYCIQCGEHCSDSDMKARSNSLLFPWLFILVIFIIACVVAGKANSVGSNFYVLLDLNCGDEITQMALNKAISASKNATANSVVSLVLCLVYLIITIANVFIACY